MVILNNSTIFYKEENDTFKMCLMCFNFTECVDIDFIMLQCPYMPFRYIKKE